MWNRLLIVTIFFVSYSIQLQQHIINNTTTTTATATKTTTVKKFRHLEPRIYGGSDIKKQIFPWIVSIVYYGDHHCGGSIINEKTILTAAHCLLTLDLRFIKIRIGSKFRSSGGQLVRVDSYKIHEKFNLRIMDYDIGIARLSDVLVFSSTVQPISLQAKESIIPDGTKALVLGWGAIDLGIYPELLQYLQIEVMSNDKCNKYMHNLVTDRMLCSGYLFGGHDACDKDSGGPLVSNHKLIGIVSWGMGCAKPNRLGVYANISVLRNWIEDTLFFEYDDKLPKDID